MVDWDMYKSRIKYWLSRVRLSRLIVSLLVILIIAPMVAHYYLSKLPSDTDGLVHRSRSKLDHPDDLDGARLSELKVQIDELKRIKASVNNELRELESKRQKLQAEITSYHSQVGRLSFEYQGLDKDVKSIKLTLDHLRLEKEEIVNQYMPILRAPVRILASTDTTDYVAPPANSHHCKMFSCFDFSQCSLLSGFPVYVYDPDRYLSSIPLMEFVKSSVLSAVSVTPYVTRQPSKACVYVVLTGEIQQNMDKQTLQTTLHSLPYWRGDGRNHLLINLARTPKSFDAFYSVDIGRALIIQSSFVESYFRADFDIVIPPSLGITSGQVWDGLPPISPVRRKFFLSFLGYFKSNLALQKSSEIRQALKSQPSPGDKVTDVKLGVDDKEWNNFDNFPDFESKQNENANLRQDDLQNKFQFQQRQLKSVSDTTSLLSIETAIVSSLKEMQTTSKDGFFLQFTCERGDPEGINAEWGLCGNEHERASILKQSTFSLIISPANTSFVSTTVFQIRLYEALKYGAIPVILNDEAKLPFSEILDWKKAAVILPKSRATEFHFLIHTFTDSTIAGFRKQGRFLWETYFSTSHAIIHTTLSILRTRLQIPAVPMREEPSPSVFNSSFISLKLEGPDPEPETDEMLGPMEPPFPSLRFHQNFSQSMVVDKFNRPGDPFHLFPFTPFQTLLPSESKFLGSSYGYRPVGRGRGGAGKEFSEALGGNLPREQFTIVMLTFERETVLISAIQRLKGLPFLNKVVVVWNNPIPPSLQLRWPEIGIPIEVIKTTKNSLNNRFLPYDAIETEAILSIDDDAHLRHDEIVFGFRVWREEREKIVGFPGRFHAWDLSSSNQWRYDSNYSCELSMVLTGAAFFHKYYAYLYSYVMPQAIRDKVDEYINCEDIAMNFLVSHITGKPPVKVTSRWTFRCPGCPQTLSNDSSHFEERHQCINFFVEVYGYMPLLYTQYRVDSVLFKTRLPHDKQKCFKFI